MDYFYLIIFSYISLALSAQTNLPPSQCLTKYDEQAWSLYLSKHFKVVFPDGNRNFGGSKWFELCEARFWPLEKWGSLSKSEKEVKEAQAKKMMRCCSRSYCPYSGAIAGGAARRYNQVLLDYCINKDHALSVCCSPCVCHLGPGSNKSKSSSYKIENYKGLENVLFEKIASNWKPVSFLSKCQKDKTAFKRKLDSNLHNLCTKTSHDPMRGGVRSDLLMEASSSLENRLNYFDNEIEVQKVLQDKCNLASDYKARTNHCFVDYTHHTCCKLGPKARNYSNKSGNPIGSSAELAASLLKSEVSEKQKSWCTCFGSKVCSDYAKRFGREDTYISFIYKPQSYPPEIIVDVPAKPACEEKVREMMGVRSHRTPGVNLVDKLKECKEVTNVWFEEQTRIYCFEDRKWYKKSKYGAKCQT